MTLLAGSLAAGFLLVATITLLAVVRGRGNWQPKLALILLVAGWAFASAFTVNVAIGSFRGYPATAAPPRDGRFVAAIVHEPNARLHDNGLIYLWLIPSGNDTPRAYRVAYTRQLHQQVANAQQAAAHNVAVGLKRTTGKTKGQSTQQRYLAYRLPPPAPPVKGKP